MMITSKSRYALKVMMDLASKPEGSLEQRHGIAARQGIPVDYIDQILIRLRQGGLVESVRGRSGGFSLKKPPEKITVWDILSVSEESLYPVLCMTHAEEEDCVSAPNCTTRGPWEDIIGAIQGRLAEMRLSDLVEQWGDSRKGLELGDVAECRGPKRSGTKTSASKVEAASPSSPAP